MPTRKQSASIAAIGVTRTQLYVQEDLGWLFREQPTEDYGIDAQVEIVDGDKVRGRLLAFQIKSGESWFDQPTAGGWWFRPDEDHARYWINHSLPVAVVLYDPRTNLCHWQLVNDSTLEQSRAGGWRLLVPEAHVLDRDAAAVFRRAAAGDPFQLRLRELQLSRPWMDMLAEGTRLVVDIEEWVNKTSGRGSITLGIDHEDGKDPEPLANWGVWLGLASYADVVPRLFAWADVNVHEQTYDWADQEFSGGNGLRPYKNGAGEVDFWRLELALNELGKAFVVVDRFASDGLPQLAPPRP
ncbi:DUF4365 domain-containing protein [Kribbella solani]|uniref:DUF4365 domain-containing protein n=1 Tax=Kribbella solani TaxID=236067 RepID=UPI0029B31070|nr:DUF4365 domain-containing protein [Kribbella solani]MDX2973373.1 DUF4365 domain-containing protein [Kribbella solani]